MDSPPRLSNDSFVFRFPARLWRIVNSCTSGAITWGPSGKTIRILRKRFEREYLINAESRPFKTSKFASFVRQLNHYGFKKVTTPIMIGETKEEAAMLSEYHHPLFTRGHPEFISFLHRRYRHTLASNERDSTPGKRKRRVTVPAKAEKENMQVPDEQSVVVLHRLIRSPEDHDDTNRGDTSAPSTDFSPPSLTQSTQQYFNLRALHGVLPRGRRYPGPSVQYPYPGGIRSQIAPYRFPPVRPAIPAPHIRGFGYGNRARAAIAHRFRPTFRAATFSRALPQPQGFPTHIPNPQTPFWRSPSQHPSIDAYSGYPAAGMRYYEGEAREAKPFVAGLGRSGYAACYGPGGDEFDDSQVAPPGEWSTSFDFNERLGVAGRRRGLPLPQEFLPVGQRISKTFPRIPGAAESAAEGGFSSGYLRSESVSRPAARGVDNNGTVEDRNPDAVQLSQKVDEEDSNAGAASSDVTASYLKPGEHYENEGAEHGSVGTADNAYMGERVRIMRIVQAPSTQTSSSSPKYRLAPAPAMTQQRGGSKLPRQAAKYHPHAQYTNFPLSVHEETVYKGQAGWDRTSAAVMPYSSIQETIMIDTLIDTSAGQFGNAVSVADDSWNNAATLAVHFPRDMVTSVRNDGDHALEPQVHYDTAAAAAEEGRNAVDDAPTMAESADAPIARNNDSDLDNRDHGTAFTAAANTAQNQAILQQRYRDDGTFTEVTSQATPLPPQNLGGTSRSVGVNVDTMQATDEKIIRAAGDHATPLGYARTAHDILLIKTDNAYAFPDRRVGESHAYHVELSQQGQERPTRAAAAATHVLPKTGHYWNSSTAAAECAAYRPPQARRIENTKTGDENRAAGPQRDTALTELTCRVSCTPQKSSERAGSSQDLAHLSSASVQELLSAVIHAPGADGAEVMGDPPCPDKVAFVLRKDSSGEITGYVMLDEPSK